MKQSRVGRRWSYARSATASACTISTVNFSVTSSTVARRMRSCVSATANDRSAIEQARSEPPGGGLGQGNRTVLGSVGIDHDGDVRITPVETDARNRSLEEDAECSIANPA